MGIRISFIIFIFGVLYSLLAFNIYDLQFNEGSGWKAEAAFKKISTLSRGSIYFTDKEGNAVPAAINKDYPIIFADPSKIIAKERKQIAETLSDLTGKTPEALEIILSKKGSLYEPLVKKATEEQVDFINKNSFSGIDVIYESSRFYPLKETGSQILGYVSSNEPEWKGLYGAELFYDAELKGKTDENSSESKNDYEIKGADIFLTIDRNIQVQAEETLNNLVDKFDAEGGTVIVEDPQTGKILALANNPTFDPNVYSKSKQATFMNPGVQSVYEPGSIFKVITMAAGIDSGKITPNTTFVDKGFLTLNGKTIRNWDLKAHGKVTMTNVIEQSINTGAAFAEKTLGHEAFYDYLVKFGFNDNTKVDLPGEVIGSLKPLKNNSRDINFATASFGQGISVTPIRLISAISTIANGGVSMKPFLNMESKPEMAARVVSAEASRKVVDMMVSAVDKAEIARIKGYTVAGKTGTAQIPDFKKGGYSKEYIHTYVGFAPAYNPKFIVLIKLDKPKGVSLLAGATVVPAFRDLSQFILNYYNIPPDNVDSISVP
jgi:cell division protein FtsI/penicillin-binding protein 2